MASKKTILDGRESEYFTYIVFGGIFARRFLDGKSYEAEYGTNPQQQREASKQLLTKLQPLGGSLRRTQLVTTITSQYCFSLIRCMTLNAQTI